MSVTNPRLPSLQARLTRLAAQPVRGGLLSIEDAGALAAAGFEPISEVIGAATGFEGGGGFYSSGNLDLATGRGRTYTSTAANVAVGTPPSLIALKARYALMLNRLVSEARAVGADGVIGIKIERSEIRLEPPLSSFVATGTAVRAVGRVHSDRPFTTDLSGAQVASALRSGWVPVSLLITPCMAIRRIDQFSQSQRRRWAGNGEVDAYTDLVTTCRAQARKDFTAAAGRIGADGAVLSEISLRFHPVQTEGSATALVTVIGTALAGFRPPARQPRPLTMLRLGSDAKENSS